MFITNNSIDNLSFQNGDKPGSFRTRSPEPVPGFQCCKKGFLDQVVGGFLIVHDLANDVVDGRSMSFGQAPEGFLTAAQRLRNQFCIVVLQLLTSLTYGPNGT